MCCSDHYSLLTFPWPSQITSHIMAFEWTAFPEMLFSQNHVWICPYFSSSFVLLPLVQWSLLWASCLNLWPLSNAWTISYFYSLFPHGTFCLLIYCMCGGDSGLSSLNNTSRLYLLGLLGILLFFAYGICVEVMCITFRPAWLRNVCFVKSSS